jgi:hypothetical protein
MCSSAASTTLHHIVRWVGGPLTNATASNGADRHELDPLAYADSLATREGGLPRRECAPIPPACGSRTRKGGWPRHLSSVRGHSQSA